MGSPIYSYNMSTTLIYIASAACKRAMRCFTETGFKIWCDISVTMDPKHLCSSLHHRTHSGKVNLGHSYNTVTFQNPHDFFRKLGVHFSPWGHEFTFNTVDLSPRLVSLNTSISIYHSIFLSYMPRMYTKGSRMIPGWIEAEEKFQEIEFNYWVQIQHRWYP